VAGAALFHFSRCAMYLCGKHFNIYYMLTNSMVHSLYLMTISSGGQKTPRFNGDRNFITVFTNVVCIFSFPMFSIYPHRHIFLCLITLTILQLEVLCVVTLYSVVVGYQRFGDPCCVLLRGEVAGM
jgi:hypothetical protein